MLHKFLAKVPRKGADTATEPMLPLENVATPLQSADNAAASTAPRRSRACQFGGALLLAYGALNACIWKKFTPVYTATECGDQRAVLDELSLGASSIEMSMQIEVTCTNPNPYGIEILTSTPGRVFVKLGEMRMQIGDLKVIPGSSLPEQGTGTIRVRMDAKLSGEQADALLPHFLEDSAVPMLMELKFNVGVSLAFGIGGIGGSWGTTAPFEKACGLNMAGLLVNQFLPTDGSAPTRLGPLVCRNSFHNMYIPPVGEASETPKDGRMGFSAAQVAPTEVAAGELTKNASLGVVISLCLLGGFGLLCGAPCCPGLSALAGAKQPVAKAAGARSGSSPGAAEVADGASSPAQASNAGCFSALPGLLRRLRGAETCPPAVCGSPGGPAPQTPPRAGSHGAHGRSPRGLATGSGTAVTWTAWLEQLQRVATRSLSPVRVAAARYFPASMVSPRSSPASTAFDFGVGGQQQATRARQASAGPDPMSPLETARRQLQFPAEFSSPGGGPSALEEARGSPRPPPSSRHSSRRGNRDEVRSEMTWSKESPRSRAPAPPQWPQQAWSPSRESAWSGGMPSRGPSRPAPDAGGADAIASRDVMDAEGVSTAASRLQSRTPAASPRVSSRSSAPYAGPSSKR